MRQKMLPQCNCFMMHFKLGSDRGGRCIRYLQNRCPGPDWSQSWCLADLLGPVRSIQQEIFYLAMLDFILYALNSHTFTTCHVWTICVAVLALWVILTLLSKIQCIYSSFGKPAFAPWFFHFLPDDQRTKGNKANAIMTSPSTLWLIIVFLRWSIVNVFINAFTDIQLYQQIYVDI